MVWNLCQWYTIVMKGARWIAEQFPIWNEHFFGGSPSQVFSCHHTSWSVHSSVPFELLEIPSTKNHTATPVGSEVFVFGVLVNKKRLVRNPANQLRLIHKNTYSWWDHHLFIPVFFKVLYIPGPDFSQAMKGQFERHLKPNSFFYTGDFMETSRHQDNEEKKRDLKSVQFTINYMNCELIFISLSLFLFILLIKKS